MQTILSKNSAWVLREVWYFFFELGFQVRLAESECEVWLWGSKKLPHAIPKCTGWGRFPRTLRVDVIYGALIGPCRSNQQR